MDLGRIWVGFEEGVNCFVVQDCERICIQMLGMLHFSIRVWFVIQ